MFGKSSYSIGKKYCKRCEASTNFYSPSAGTIKVAAELTGQDKNQSADSVISVVVTQAWLPVILLAFLITGAIASIVIFGACIHVKSQA